jgi:hypothetical protein
MGIEVELQDERCVTLEVVSPGRFLALLLPPLDDDAHPMLALIDPYGDTIFNRIQMTRFLREWSYPRRRKLKRSVCFFQRLKGWRGAVATKSTCI